jgi:hypothetical protein
MILMVNRDAFGVDGVPGGVGAAPPDTERRLEPDQIEAETGSEWDTVKVTVGKKP